MSKKRPKETAFVAINICQPYNNTFQGEVNKVINPKSAQSQMEYCLKITDDIFQKDFDFEKGALVIENVLMPVFMKAMFKNPMKRALRGCLQKLEPRYGNMIKVHLLKELHIVLQYSKDKSVYTRISASDFNASEINATIEIMMSLMDNFTSGEKALLELHGEVLHHLNLLLHIIERQINDSTSSIKVKGPAETSKLMTLALTITKQQNKVLQKLQQHPRTEMQQLLRDLLLVSKRYITADVELDLRINTAISAILILKHEFQENLVETLRTLLREKRLDDVNIEEVHLDITDVPDMSYICLLYAINAMLDPKQLLHVNHIGEVFLTDFLGDKLITLMNRINDKNSDVILSRTILLYTTKCRQFVNSSDSCPMAFREALHLDSNLTKNLLQYVYNHWEDNVDVIRFQVHDVFENIIASHVITCKDISSSEKTDHLESLAKSLLHEGFNRKGIYGPLGSLVKHIGASKLLEFCPTIVKHLLNGLSEQALSSHVSDLYENLLKNHCKELQEKEVCMDKSQEYWQSLWLEPVLHILTYGSESQQKNATEYLLPKMLRSDASSLFYICQSLSSKCANLHGNHIGALITCLKRAKAMGILNAKFNKDSLMAESQDNSSLETNSKKLWNDIVEIDILRQAFCHQDEQIRLDAIGLLVENPKTSMPVDEVDLNLLLEYMPCNLNCQMPSFRQQLLAYMKKLFVRLQESGMAVKRKINTLNDNGKNGMAEENILKTYLNFNCELVKILLSNLHPCAAFPGRTTCLAILSLVASTYRTKTYEHEFCFAEMMDDHVSWTLFEYFSDNFEQNKMEVYNIFMSLPRETWFIKNEKKLNALLNVCCELYTNTKPQDCSTAAYMLKVLVHIPAVFQVLRRSSKVKQLKTFEIDKLENNLMNRILLVLLVLLHELREEVRTGQISLLHAAASRPMYPVIHCIRYLLRDVHFNDVVDSILWKEYLQDLIGLCFDVSTTVAPVVTNSSPEGNVCYDPHVLGSILKSDPNQMYSAEEIEESSSKVKLMPEYLTVCCWRSIKEVSLLFGEVMQRAPVDGLITVPQVLQIGEYFKTELLHSIHRGAFELAYAGFVKMTAVLWKSSVPDLHELPMTWLQEIMDAISSCNQNLCSTRRSAGVPFFIQAILASEPSSLGPNNLRQVMERLLRMADKSEETEESAEDTAHVHALNILRALFRDNNIGDEVFYYAGQGLKVAITGYKSKFWSIRNSASLLFSAVVVRIFGVKRSKEGSVDKKNCMTGRVFFHKFPLLYEFLLQEIISAANNIGNSDELHLNASLYPVLLILGRLLPSSIDTHSCMNLAAFIPHLIKCAGSAVYKTREIAAYALKPVIRLTEIYDVIHMILCVVNTDQCTHNYMHGTFLQVNALLEKFDGKVNDEGFLKILPSLVHTCKKLKNSSCCPVLNEFSKILFKVLHIIPLTSSKSEECAHFVEFIHLCAQNAVHRNEREVFAMEYSQQLLQQFLLYLASVDDKKTMESYILNLLSSKQYELQLVALRFIESQKSERTAGDTSTLTTSDSCWLQFINSFSLKHGLIKMLLNENLYLECMVLVLKCLNFLEDVEEYQTDFQENVSVKLLWKRLLELVTFKPCDIQNAAVDFIGRNFKFFFKSLDIYKKEIVFDMTEVIETCSRTPQIREVRLAAAVALCHNAESLLVSSKVLESCSQSMWTVVIRLLQDEDIHIRNTVANTVSQLSEGHFKDKKIKCIEPNMALDICIKLFCDLSIYSNPMETISQLLSWIEEDIDPWESQDKDVRLFDKGEMNPYCDQLLVPKIVQNNLSTIKDSFNLLEESVKVEVQTFLENKFNTCCSEVIARLEWINPYSMRSAFVDSEESKIDILFLSQKVLLVVVLFQLLQDEKLGVKNNHTVQLNSLREKLFSKFENEGAVLNHTIYKLLSPSSV